MNQKRELEFPRKYQKAIKIDCVEAHILTQALERLDTGYHPDAEQIRKSLIERINAKYPDGSVESKKRSDEN